MSERSDLLPASRQAAGTSDVVLDVRDLNVNLHLGSRTVPVLNGVSFDIAAGQILGVVGESGSGKSMTALSIMRMLPAAGAVESGSIRFQDRDLLAMSEDEIAALRGDRLGMVFQDPFAFLNPLMTVGAQIREVLLLHGATKERAAARAVELLEMVGVRDAAKRVDDYPHQFSGGMRQRVVIAIAVANNPSLLIADEPTTALDVTVQAEILRLLRRLRDDLGAGLMLITHDISIVEEVCDSVMVMYAGHVVERGTTRDVLRNPQHPYTRALMRSTPRLGVPANRRLHAIPGQPPDIMRRPGGCPFNPRCPLVMDRCLVEMPPLVHHGGSPSHVAACWAADSAPPAVVLEPAADGDASESADNRLILDVRDVSIGYEQGGSFWRRAATRPVVQDVSLKAYAGRTLGLVGESGSGKSTVARAIVGLLPLISGSITIDGRQWANANAESRAALRRTVQMVFQDPYMSLNPRQTIGQILVEPLVVHAVVPPSARRARVEELASLVGLPKSVLDRYPYQLSGGQRQRVGIARALAVEPKLIVADEPVSALDVSVQAQIINLLADLRDRLGLGYLVIAHDLSVVRHLCDDVAVMEKGRIVEYDTAEQVFTNPQHPYTITLLAAAPGSARAKEQAGVTGLSADPLGAA